MSEFIKAERVVRAALGLLERDTVLAKMVWRDAGGDFRGAKDDMVSIRLPAYFVAHQRDMRSGAARTRSSLHERRVNVRLDTNVYGDIPFSDEQLTLDIENFGDQVLAPVLGGVGRAIEDNLVDTVSGATYAHTLALDEDDPYQTAIEARTRLNQARVPQDGRVMAVGSAVEAAILRSDRLARVDMSGDSNALRDATIGRLAGLTVVSVPGLAPDEAYAFHRTAYVLSQRAPIIPAGAPWGASQSYDGFAIRTVRVFDPNEVEDRFVTDAWMGTNVVADVGHLDPVTHVFTPAENPAETGAAEHFVRAVKITADGS